LDLVDTLEPSPRHECVTLDPGFELDFAGSSSRSLRVRNACSGPIVLADPRFRLDGADFALESVLPITLPAGSEGLLDLRLLSPTPPPREDLLLVDISLDGRVLRYPIGLFAPGE
jgi:hypothetical protein